PETPREKPGELTAGGPTTAEAAHVSRVGAARFSAPRKKPRWPPRDSDAEFAAVIAAIHQSSVPSPRLQGAAAPVRVRGVTARIVCKEAASPPPLVTDLRLRSCVGSRRARRSWELGPGGVRRPSSDLTKLIDLRNRSLRHAESSVFVA